MTNLDLIVELRRDGVKPKAVFIDVVNAIDRSARPMSPDGIVFCEIAASESLADLDLRPLVGLRCHVADFSGARERHRRIAALVAQADPALLVMPIAEDNGGYLVHRRWGGPNPRTESFRL